ncbi:hypothetical protein AGMMS50262_05960 [Bacteroidia bacterium]|nr:hypothetical protein AGMMS50262_05960 [Bacteroidia bacterium]
MEKEKFHIEYVLEKVSVNNLWPRLATSSGLSEWFADNVTENGNIFTFYWDKYPSEAELTGINPFNYVRFHWLEEEPDTYFEFRLHKDELTGILTLEITDFSDDKNDIITLWDTQIKVLKRKLGI